MNSKLIGEAEAQKKLEHTVAKYHELLGRWAEITPSKRREFLGNYMQNQIAKAIGISPSELDMQQSLKYLGIDSLIAVKLRNQLRTDWSVELATVKFLDDFSLWDLVILVEEEIEKTKSNTYISGLELQQEEQQKDTPHPSMTKTNDDNWLEGEL